MIKQSLILGSITFLLASCSAFSLSNAYGDISSPGVAFTDSAPAGSGSNNIAQLLSELVQDTNQLKQDVKNNSSILVSQWNLQQKAKAAASAQLLPSSLSFLWENGGYQYMAGLAQSNQDTQQVIMQAVAPSDCQQGQTGSQACQQAIIADPITSILMPLTVQNVTLNQKQTAYGVSETSQSTAIQGQLLQMRQTLPQTYTRRLMGVKDPLATYAIAQIMASNSSTQGPSINKQLESAVMQPFSSNKTTDTQQTWFQALSTASTPQLLRMIAVQIAVHNYLAYKQYQLAQTQQMIDLVNVSKLLQLHRDMGDLQESSQNNTNQITTAIYQLDRDVQKMAKNQ